MKIKNTIDQLDEMDRKLTDILSEVAADFAWDIEHISANDDMIEEIKQERLETREDALDKIRKASRALTEAYLALEEVPGSDKLTWANLDRLKQN